MGQGHVGMGCGDMRTGGADSGTWDGMVGHNPGDVGMGWWDMECGKEWGHMGLGR